MFRHSTFTPSTRILVATNLFEIANGVDTPLLIDGVSKKRPFGHYARILVDIDLSKRIFEEVMVEQEGYPFYVNIVYDRLSELCSRCFTIGHSVFLCNKLHPKHKRISQENVS